MQKNKRYWPGRGRYKPLQRGDEIKASRQSIRALKVKMQMFRTFSSRGERPFIDGGWSAVREDHGAILG